MAFPAGFTLLSQGSIESAREVAVTSNAVTIGDLLALAVGATTWADGTSSTAHWQRKGVAVETIASTATVIKLQMVLPGQLWIAELANNSAAADNGDRMVLTDTNTVNNTGTDSAAKEAVFIQDGVVGAAAEKRAVGILIFGTGVNPDAT